MEWICCGLMRGTVPAFSWRDSRTAKPSVKMVSLQAEIWTQHLLYTEQECLATVHYILSQKANCYGQLSVNHLVGLCDAKFCLVTSHYLHGLGEFIVHTVDCDNVNCIYPIWYPISLAYSVSQNIIRSVIVCLLEITRSLDILQILYLQT